MRRVFVGIRVSLEIQEAVRTWRQSYHDLPVRWIRDADLHITIVPPWNEEGKIQDIIYRMTGAVAGRHPFRIDIHKIVFAPDPRKPKLIWAEGSAVEKLTALKQSLLARLRKEDPRPLRPHITIARFNRANFSQFRMSKLYQEVNWRLTVQSLVLYESPKIPGTGYKILAEVPLEKRPERARAFYTHSMGKVAELQ